MLQRFMSILAPESQKHQQAQREAMVDLLVWTMYADGHLSLDEQDVVEQEMTAIAWESDQPLSAYVLDAAGKVRRAMGDEDATVALLSDIAKRLGDAGTRTQALAAAERLAGADETLKAKERAFLERVRKRFTLAD